MVHGIGRGLTSSVVSQGNLIKQIAFPKIVLPVSAVTAGVVGFVFGLIPLFGLMAFYPDRITPYLLFIPLIAAVQFVFTLGVAFLAEVAEEDITGRDKEGHAEREDELHRGDQRDEQQVGRDAVRVEGHEPEERDQPEREPDHASGTAETGRTILGNAICLIRILLRHRRGGVPDRGREPLPRQDRREDEERIVGGAGGAMSVTKTTYTSIWSSGSMTHQIFPRKVSAPRLCISATTR